MADAKTIVWTRKAKAELLEILQYWINRNKTNKFSIKLYNLIEDQLKFISKYPNIGRRTRINNVFVKIIHDYLLYYEVVDNTLFVLSIRHGKRDPKTLKLY